jgi:hypothetical protein
MMTLDDTPTTASRHRIRLIGALIGAAAAASIALPAAADARPVGVPNALAPTSAKEAPVTSSTPVLRRDGSKATPFVADLEPAGSTAGGFDWGDAGVGAGAALLLTMSGVGGAMLVRNRRHRGERPATIA